MRKLCRLKENKNRKLTIGQKNLSRSKIFYLLVTFHIQNWFFFHYFDTKRRGVLILECVCVYCTTKPSSTPASKRGSLAMVPPHVRPHTAHKMALFRDFPHNNNSWTVNTLIWRTPLMDNAPVNASG